MGVRIPDWQQRPLGYQKHGESREEAVMLHGLEIDVMITIIIIIVIIIIIPVNYTMNKGELCA